VMHASFVPGHATSGEQRASFYFPFLVGRHGQIEDFECPQPTSVGGNAVVRKAQWCPVKLYDSPAWSGDSVARFYDRTGRVLIPLADGVAE